MSESRYVQILNPRTDKWVKIDRHKAKITVKKSKGKWKGIECVWSTNMKRGEESLEELKSKIKNTI